MTDTNAEKLGEIYVLIKTKTDQLEKEVKELRTKMDGQAESMGKSFSEKFTKFLALTGAITILTNFFKRSIQAAAEEQKAQAALAQQLGFTSKELLDQASALQKLTVFGDETIVSAQAMIAAFTKDEQKIKQLTTATLDLAAAKGMDLVSAADLVAKSFGSDTNALARYGIQVDATSGSTERLIQLTQGITNLYGGQAQAQARTFTGRMEQMKNRVGDLEERIGYALIPTIEKLTNAMNDVVTEGEKADDFFKGIAVAGRIVGSILLVIKTSLTHIGSLLGTIGASIYALASGQFSLIPTIIKNGFDKIEGNVEGLISGIKDMWTDLNEEVSKDTPRTARTIKTNTENLVSELSNSFDQFIDAVDKYYEEIKFLDENYFHWKSEKIIRQGKEMQAAGLAEVETQKWINVQLQNLMDEREKFFEDTNLDSLTMDYGKQIEEFQNRLEDAFLETELQREESVQRLREDMLSSVSEFGNELERAFGRAGDSLVNYFNNAIQAAIRIVDILAKIDSGEKSSESGALGIISSVISLFALHKGGSVTNMGGNLSYMPIPKAAFGGSFVVPPGHPNDSALVRVESGETLNVKPANRVGEQEMLLEKLINQVNVLTYNMIDNSLHRDEMKKIDVGVYGELTDDSIAISNKRGSKGYYRIR